MQVEQIGFEEWGTALPDTGFEVFHLPAALRVLDRHADAECRLYAARKGQETVALLPLFLKDRKIGRAVFSPPPGWGIPRLGPLLMPNSPKRSKKESLNRRLVDSVLKDIDATSSTTLCQLVCSLSYQDPRPFIWKGLRAEPRFTYVVELGDVSGIESAMKGFSSTLRNEMRRLDELDVTITDEGVAGAMRIYDDLENRFEEQEQSPPATRPFVRDICETLEERCQALVARGPDGNYLCGMLVLTSNDLAYYWQGGVRSTYKNVSVNNLIHRHVIEDVLNSPELSWVSGYDLVGANTERLCTYKAKFGGSLRPYYTVESSGAGMTAAKMAYRVLPSQPGK